MLRLTVTPEEWNEQIAINRTTFDAFLVTFISEYLASYNDCQKTVITLPSVTSKAERYNIHRMTIRNDFDSVSYDNQDEDRIMEVTLSKKYIQELFKDYVFVVQATPDQPPAHQPTTNQVVFNKIINIVNDHFSAEFKEYIDKI